MKEQLWKGIGRIGDDLISGAEQEKVKKYFSVKKRKHWIRYGSIAACFIIIAGMSIPMIGFMINSNRKGYVDTNNSQDKGMNVTVNPNELTGTNSFTVIGGSTSNGFAAELIRIFELNPQGFILTAKALEAYPDTYTLYSGADEYALKFLLIKMRTIERVSGSGIPDEFFYAIPEYLYQDLTVYDTLLISMVQIEYENVMVKNETQKRIEFVPMLFSSESEVRFPACEAGNIIPFTDGRLDESIWNNHKEWKYCYEYYDKPEKWKFAPRMTLANAINAAKQAVKEKIAKPYSQFSEAPTVKTLYFKSEQVKAAVQYVTTLSNGTFAQMLLTRYYDRAVFYRYVNGIVTNEWISINLITEEVTHSDTAFTTEDLSCMPDIGTRIQSMGTEYKVEIPKPPHINAEGKKLVSLVIDGWYDKIRDDVYGTIRVRWVYEREAELYTDEKFILISADGTINKEVTREELLAVIGESNNAGRIYQGEYGVGEIQTMA